MSYEGLAWNPASESDNRIHADDVARQYGFRGGLVPGVTVHALLAEPAVRSWGLDWLAQGSAELVLHKPLYDGDAFRVVSEGGGDDLRCALYGPGEVCCAESLLKRRSAVEQLPVLRGDRLAPSRDERPRATRSVLEELQAGGCGSLEVVWDGRGEQARYHESLEDMPDLVRSDRAGWAHPGFSLCLANWVLSNNVVLGPWIHVESRVRHHAAIPMNTLTRSEARILDLFERRGHEFVDLDVAVFDPEGRPLLSAFHRAIYRLREPDSAQAG